MIVIDLGQFTCDYMLLFQIVCLLIGTDFSRCVSIFDVFPLGIKLHWFDGPSFCCSVAYYLV